MAVVVVLAVEDLQTTVRGKQWPPKLECVTTHPPWALLPWLTC